jgi:Na+-driven multidrug efflux pump
LIFVSSSMFQALGNTLPSLLASFCRLALVAVPTLLLARLPTFELRWIWYLSVLAIFLQLGIASLLLRREFRLKLDAPVAARVPGSAA